MVAADPDRFLRVAVGNTGLPYNPDVDQEVIEKVHTFRASKKKYSIFKMWEEVSKMDKKSLSLEKGVKTHPALKFMWWQKWTWDTNDPAFGLVNSMQMERGSYIGRLIYYFFQREYLHGFSGVGFLLYHLIFLQNLCNLIIHYI